MKLLFHAYGIFVSRLWNFYLPLGKLIEDQLWI